MDQLDLQHAQILMQLRQMNIKEGRQVAAAPQVNQRQLQRGSDSGFSSDKVYIIKYNRRYIYYRYMYKIHNIFELLMLMY